MKNDNGYTILELMIVVGIIGVLAVTSIPMYVSYIQKARVTNLVLPNLRIIEQNIALFYASHSKLPTSLQLSIILDGADTSYFNSAMTSEEFVLTIDSPNFTNKLSLFDGLVLNARPRIRSGRLTSFELTGDLAERIGLTH